MGFYKQREEFNQAFAENDPVVRHGQPVSEEDSTPRQSFFRMNDEEELEAACINLIHLPCIVSFDLSGIDTNKDGSIRQRNNNTLLFLTNLELDPLNPVKASAMTDAYDTTFDLMQRYKNYVAEEYEINGGCGVFHYLDQAFGKWERYGPVADRLYGWIFNFTDETRKL